MRREPAGFRWVRQCDLWPLRRMVLEVVVFTCCRECFNILFPLAEINFSEKTEKVVEPI